MDTEAETPRIVIFLFALGLVSSLSFTAAVFCGIVCLFDPARQHLLNALGFLGSSAAALLVIFVVIYAAPDLPEKRRSTRRQQRRALARIDRSAQHVQPSAGRNRWKAVGNHSSAALTVKAPRRVSSNSGLPKSDAARSS